MVEKTNNIDDAEIKYKQALKNYHKESNRHVLVLKADVTEEQKRMILHTSNLIRIAGNCLATVMKRNYEQLVRTKRYRNLKSLYKKAKDTDDKKLLASVTAQIQEIQESYNVTWDFCRKEMNKIKDIYHINSIFARSKAEDVWSGIKKCLYGDGNTIHFKKYGDYPEIRAKEIKRGISVYPVVSDNGNNSLKLHIMKSEFNLTVNKPKHNKTRSGNIIYAEDILHDAIKKSFEIISEKSPNLPDKEEVAKIVGVGSVLFNDLYNQRIKDVSFSWDKVLNFDGETGPYVQYTHARCSSVVRLAENFDPAKPVDYSTISEPDAMNLLKEINRFPKVVSDAAEKYEPSVVARFAVDVAQAFNKFYNSTRINVPEENVKNARVMLTYLTKKTLHDALELLGINAPEAM